ncbi:hypothetical protein SD77_1006 [Bacillus badius]|uniref:Ribose 5-phosphate isomerase B n=1 Tax=Bacillus badius TaxID=1455 RepID=A0ABR5ATE2_BACBA|nr:hypothetical protein SD78_2479 [Bacillus badius]KIL78027.1 hypothetical protein SD77_1006 [Bacillus badius]
MALFCPSFAGFYCIFPLILSLPAKPAAAGFFIVFSRMNKPAASSSKLYKTV